MNKHTVHLNSWSVIQLYSYAVCILMYRQSSCSLHESRSPLQCSLKGLVIFCLCQHVILLSSCYTASTSLSPWDSSPWEVRDERHFGFKYSEGLSSPSSCMMCGTVHLLTVLTFIFADDTWFTPNLKQFFSHPHKLWIRNNLCPYQHTWKHIL